MKLDLTSSDYFMNLPEQEYHDYPAWSYSTIARYARGGFDAIETLHDKVEVSQEMKFGSLFDSMMTRGMEETKNSYAVFDMEYPAPAVKAALDKMFEEYACSWNELTDEAKIDVLDMLEYQNRWKPETRIASLDTGKPYYDFLVESKGKNVVSVSDWNDALEMKLKMISNTYINSIFGKPGYDVDTDIEYIYQPQFCIQHNTGKNAVNIKCMFDLIVVNHKLKTITPVDLKTSFMQAYNFPDHWLKMRYDIQAGLYTDVLEYVVDDLTDIEDDCEYRIMPYLFVDISRKDKLPVAFKFDVKMNRNLTIRNYRYKNWMELLDEIIEYEKTNAMVPSYINQYTSNDIMKLLNHE